MSRSPLALRLTPRASFLATALATPLATALVGTCLALGCRPDQPEAPRGSPVLLEVYWKGAGTSTKIWSRDADAAAPPSLPGEMTQIDFVFDRRLDGNRIEDLEDGVAVPKANPPITLSWPDSDRIMSTPPFATDVRYNSLPIYGGATAVVLLRPRAVGLPSATTVTLSLDRANLTSAYGEPMEGPETIEISVAPLTVDAVPAVPADALVPVSTSHAFRVSFNNRPGPSAELAAFARVMTGGVPLPIALAADGNDPTAVVISPAGCARGWPSGALVEVAFEAGLPDAFGVPTTGPLTAGSFLVAGTDGGPPDAGCD